MCENDTVFRAERGRSARGHQRIEDAGARPYPGSMT
ncbi:hypothetical protein SSE37_00150 [Sagittula stellata E-37]|uniref:Uncharacterized protein n=1 Tax=Sagittula stellata (strain ATCC 700073 / DSM 11524 / E-37) TaxID=388399 RepID=A3K776_SAGS3|nr:hypothetical protein SSE37_00150 [Sagittula stellata E-37]